MLAWFASFLPLLAPARMVPARGCVSRAAIKSMTGDGVDTARGLMASPFVFASISCCRKILW
jgi:hypothetical protein